MVSETSQVSHQLLWHPSLASTDQVYPLWRSVPCGKPQPVKDWLERLLANLDNGVDFPGESFHLMQWSVHKPLSDWQTQPVRATIQSGSRRWFPTEGCSPSCKETSLLRKTLEQHGRTWHSQQGVNPKMDFRLEFNQEDPELWFATLEHNMLTHGIKQGCYEWWFQTTGFKPRFPFKLRFHTKPSRCCYISKTKLMTFAM